MNLSLAWILILFTFNAVIDHAFADQSVDELAQQMAKLDQEFFQRGFNQCDIEYLQQHVSDDLVFYHDQSGRQNKKQFMANTQKYLCADPQNKPIRKRVPGTLTTSPLFDQGQLYGAVQTGEHQFYLRSSNAADVLTSRAKFSHVWHKYGDDWQLANVLSYEHSSPSENDKQMLTILGQSRVPAMAIGIIENHQIVSTKVYGELRKDVPAPQNSLFKVASLTKPVVAMLTLRLVAEGKLDLDEKLSEYWVDPDIRDDPRHQLLTPRLVLSHQTGFENWRWMSADKTLQFMFTPGDKHHYSGEGFEYLRKALEAKFSRSIEQLAERLVFKPAGMSDTYFWWQPEVDEALYALNHDSHGTALPLHTYHQANAAANLLMTIDDYSRFLQFVMQQREAMPALYQQMISAQVNLGPDDDFGLGWQILSDFPNQERALLHTGRDPGVNTLAIFFPKSGNGYVIFLNGDNATPVLEKVLPTLYLGRELWNKR